MPGFVPFNVTRASTAFAASAAFGARSNDTDSTPRDASADELKQSDAQPLRLPAPGDYSLRILSPTLLELCLITTKDPKLESQDKLRRRIDEAAKYLPLENLAISPQCGFASVAAGNLLSIDEQWRKLELVQQVAAEVWG